MLDYLIKGGLIVDGSGAPPFAGDVGIRDGMIVSVGNIEQPAREVIDAAGAIVTPGFFDLHTHYDGQVTWDDALEPSATNGVSTVILGNCGVGFAPVRPSDHAQLIDMMEGVEDIPGTALSVGMPWGEWESFPEYLDFIARRNYAVNIACHVAHAPLRYYVMGERAYEDHDATAQEIEQMATLLEEAMAAGAAGFSTNRWSVHKSKSGKPVPGTFAAPDELRVLSLAMARQGHGVIQAIAEGTIYPDDARDDIPDLDLLAEISIESRRPLTFSTFQAGPKSKVYRRILDGAAAWNARGAQLRPQIIPRAVTVITTLDGYHGFEMRPSYQAIAHLPLRERAAEMRRPEVRERILSEDDIGEDSLRAYLAVKTRNRLHAHFPLRAPIDYEPAPSDSITGQAQALGKDPLAHYYDLLTEDDGSRFFAAFDSGFEDGTLEPGREMLLDPNTVSGLGDAGAHVLLISDCSVTTFHLTHWVRDRTKGDRVPLELAVHKLTGAAAEMYDFADRGLIREGLRADVNVIDLDRLAIHEPFMRADLPTGASRILQPSTGYRARLVNGVMVRRDDTDTGARPGHLIRSCARAPT